MDILTRKFNFDQKHFKKLSKDGDVIYISNTHFKWLKTSSTGSVILNKLNGRKTVSQVAKEISEEFGMPYDICEKDIIHFISVSLERNLISNNRDELHPLKIDGKIRYLFLDITNQCNLNCTYCNKNVIKNAENAKFIEPNDVKQNLHKLFPNGEGSGTVVNISGGEPLFHKRLFEIIDIIKSFNCQIFIWTNGILLDDMAKLEIFKKKEVNFIISIDSDKKETNDRLRGKGSFDAAIRASELCAKHNILFFNAITITTNNIYHMERFLPFSRHLGSRGIYINQSILVHENGHDLSELFNYDLKIYDSTLTRMHKTIKIINSWKNDQLKADEKSRDRQLLLTDHGRCLNHCFRIRNKVNCGAGINEIAIDVNGYLYPCHTLQVKCLRIGNMDDYIAKNFKVIKTSDIDECRECDFKIFCLGGCRAEAFYRNGNINGKYSFCDTMKKNINSILWTPMISK